jgi:DNA-binding transcriptional ArsR family regulator
VAAQPRPQPEDRPVILPIPRETPPRRNPATGFTMVANYLTEMSELPPGGAYRVLVALLRLSWRTRWTRASIGQISQASNTPRRSVQRHLEVLTELGLIARRPDPKHAGREWITRILCDPPGEKRQPKTKLEYLYKGKSDPRQNGAGSRHNGAGSRHNGAGPFHSLEELLEDVVVLGPEHDDDASASPRESEPKTPAPPGPAPAAAADLAARARAAWPDQADIDRRVAELVDLAGEAKAALLIAYAAARQVKRFTYVFTVLKSWRRLTVAECAERVAETRAKRPTPSPMPPPAHVATKTPAPDADPVVAGLVARLWRASGDAAQQAEIQAAIDARVLELELETGTSVPI